MQRRHPQPPLRTMQSWRPTPMATRPSVAAQTTWLRKTARQRTMAAVVQVRGVRALARTRSALFHRAFDSALSPSLHRCSDISPSVTRCQDRVLHALVSRSTQPHSRRRQRAVSTRLVPSHRTCQTLTRFPLCRYHGHDLLVDATLELNHGRSVLRHSAHSSPVRDTGCRLPTQSCAIGGWLVATVDSSRSTALTKLACVCLQALRSSGVQRCAAFTATGHNKR